jgi:DNA-binding XRE family transcriptional regulator
MQRRRKLTFDTRRDITRVRTPAELGALVRDYRTRLRLDQKSLAEKVGVSRQWIVDVEKGKWELRSDWSCAPYVCSASPSTPQQKVPKNQKDKAACHGLESSVPEP